MRIVRVTLDNNIEYLHEFVSMIRNNVKSFRYYNTRPISIIENHIVTLLFIDNEKAIAYGHLDKEKENVWLGICILPEYSGKGYGKKMMNALFEEAKNFELQQILLTVDKDNHIAINLYEKMNFKRIEKADCYKYVKLLHD